MTTKNGLLIWRAVIGIFVLIMSSFVYGHSPHDVIDILRISDSPEPDTLFIVVSHKLLLRSIDGGASWKELNNGLDNRYSYTDMAVLQSNACVSVYLSTDGDGIYKSDDGGSTWRGISQNLPDERIMHLYATGNGTLLAAGTSGGLYLTEDEGTSWKQVMGRDVTVAALGVSGNIVLSGDAHGHIYRSADSGFSWAGLNGIPGTSISAVSVLSEKTFLIGTRKSGLYRTVDGGSTFKRTSNGIEDRRITAIAKSTEAEGRVFVSTWEKAVYKSRDDGENWRLLTTGLTTDPQAGKPTHYSPQFRDIVVASDGTLYVAGFDGLFRSSSQGEEWQQVVTLGEGRIMEMGASPANRSAIIGVTTYGGGAYFMDLDTDAWEIRNYGLVNPRLTDITFYPRGREEMGVYTAAPGELLFTVPKDEPWQMEKLKPGQLTQFRKKLSNALRRVGAPVSVASWILTDEEKRKPFPTRIAVETGLESEGIVLIGTRRHGVLRKVPGEEYYTTVLDRNEMISSLEISPNFRDDRIVYVSARQDGIFMSRDGGATWESVNTGLDFIREWNNEEYKGERKLVELARSPYFDIHLAISPDFSNDTTLFAGTGDGLYRSPDGGAHWVRQRITPDAQEQVITVSVSPEYKTDKTVIVSVKGRGMYISNDKGMSFEPYGQVLREGNQEIRHIEFSKKLSEKVVVAASSESVFYTRDNGRIWKQLVRPVRIEEKRERVQYSGPWKRVISDQYSSYGAKRSGNAPSSAMLSFWGNGIRWIGDKGPDLPPATVIIDEYRGEPVEQYSVSALKSTTVYEKTGLVTGPHTIEVRGGAVIDAFDILGGQ